MTAYSYGADTGGDEEWRKAITNPSYYLNANEAKLLTDPAVLKGIAGHVGENATLIELGPGSTALEKTAPLIEALKNPVGYKAIDIEEAYAIGSAGDIKNRFPHIQSTAIVCNFSDERLNKHVSNSENPVLFFVGNTIGNIGEDENAICPTNTIGMLRRFRDMSGENAHLIISQDTNREKNSLYDAYYPFREMDFSVLTRAEQELGINVDKSKMDFRVVIEDQNPKQSCVNCQLVATEDQKIVIPDYGIHTIHAGDAFTTTKSHKFESGYFAGMAQAAGWKQKAVYLDSQNRMALHVFKSR